MHACGLLICASAASSLQPACQHPSVTAPLSRLAAAPTYVVRIPQRHVRREHNVHLSDKGITQAEGPAAQGAGRGGSGARQIVRKREAGASEAAYSRCT